MLNFIITLAIIGAIIGLVFSRRGDESGGFFRGAKSGAKIGCVICLGAIVIIAILVIVIAGTV